MARNIFPARRSSVPRDHHEVASPTIDHFKATARTLADFAKALDSVAVPPGIHAAVTAQLAWNVERLQAGLEVGERPSGYRRKGSANVSPSHRLASVCE